jgi:hypothetical protein
MAFQLQAFKANALLYAEANRNRVRQTADFLIASAATDTALDVANDTTGSLGTFWTAVIADSTYGSVGTAALAVIQNIVNLCKNLDDVSSEVLLGKTRVGTSSIMSFLSAAVGTGPTVTATVTGLLATDTVLAVTQQVANANTVVPVAFGTPAANALPLTYAAANGGSGQVLVLVNRTTGTIVPTTGAFDLTVSGHLPLITFASSNAPTTQLLHLEWLMQDGVLGVNADFGAAF